MVRFISYLRVSTDKQGRSGLGLEAQRAAVEAHAAATNGAIVAEFVEVESGRKTKRAQLDAALAACRARRAVLLIAKLDRLARNVAFVCRLMEAGVEFIAADLPTVNKLTIHILAAVAEEEARTTSARTKAALAAAKARGVRLGNPHLKPGTREQALAANRVAAKVITAKARRYAADMAPVISLHQGRGRHVAGRDRRRPDRPRRSQPQRPWRLARGDGAARAREKPDGLGRMTVEFDYEKIPLRPIRGGGKDEAKAIGWTGPGGLLLGTLHADRSWVGRTATTATGN